MDATFHPGPLAFLSLQRCPRGTVPAAPTNAERARAFRDVRPAPELHNAYGWPHLSAPAKEEACPRF